MTAPAMEAIHYEGRSFRSASAETSTASDAPVGHYHQRGSTVWAEFSGGTVVRGYLVGRQTDDGRLDLAYCQFLADDTVVSGRCVSTPEILPNGRIRLREEWERLGEGAGRGVSYIEEITERDTGSRTSRS